VHTLDLPTPSLLVERGAFDRNVDDRVGGLLGAEIVGRVSQNVRPRSPAPVPPTPGR
jgi:hypothetical protein